MTCVVLQTQVFGYLDPGSGNVLINIVLGGVGALLYSLKGLFYHLSGQKDVKNNVVHDIVLFNEGNQYKSTFNPLIEELIKKKRHFFYYTLDVEDSALSIDSEYMTSKFLGYGIFASLAFYKLKGSVLLSTTPNIGTPEYPLKKPAAISNMVHVFHSVSDISIYMKSSLDFYDIVIMPGDFTKDSIRQIEKVRNLPTKKLLSLGLPYLDELVQNCDRQEKCDTRTVLIGSSWGNKGCLKTYGSTFISNIAEAGYDVIVRPHPQSVKTEQKMLQSIKKTLSKYRNVVWDETISPTDSMNKADILISDTSAIRFDFAFIYEKPVITLDIPADEMRAYERTYLNNIWSDTSGHDIGYVIQRDNISEISDYIRKALRAFNPSKIQGYRDKTIANYGNSAAPIVNFIIEAAKV